eukprot:TRINITY_DN3276_c0_g2_i2.p1 TRINITY_DN3276_c0_g2~~TRINITY_DN3276_c0_g2_i2.p1  ORF type:complete len:928 (+),score=185.06 TRINITY_DN3276_c0_g2_i2:81-2864(+)
MKVVASLLAAAALAAAGSCPDCRTARCGYGQRCVERATPCASPTGCCPAIVCEDPEYDCRTEEVWTQDKRQWCCEHEHKGCRDGSVDALCHTCESTFCPAIAGMSCREKEVQCVTAPCCPLVQCGFDCSGAADGWTPEQAQWCCEHEQKGCGATGACRRCSSSPCPAGMRCNEKEVQCVTTPCCPDVECEFDCTSKEVWSSRKSRWCCIHKGEGCVEPSMLPSPVSPPKPGCQSCATTMCPALAGMRCIETAVECVRAPCCPLVECGYDCRTDEAWTTEKKAWCCARGMGSDCVRSPVPAPTKSSCQSCATTMCPALAGMRCIETNVYCVREPCCPLIECGYDCHTDEAWTTEKKAWCSARGMGNDSARSPVPAPPRSGCQSCATTRCPALAGMRCVETTVYCVREPCCPLIECGYDCHTDEAWTTEKKAWCCARGMGSGCARSPVSASPKRSCPSCAVTDCRIGTRCVEQPVQCVTEPCCPIVDCIEACSSCSSTQCQQGTECVERRVECVREPCCPVVECAYRCLQDVAWLPGEAAWCCAHGQGGCEQLPSPVSRTPVQSCPQRERYNTCASACPRRCGDTGEVLCAAVCVPGCECVEGHVRAQSGACVPEAMCPLQVCACNSFRQASGAVFHESMCQSREKTGGLQSCRAPSAGGCTDYEVACKDTAQDWNVMGLIFAGVIGSRPLAAFEDVMTRSGISTNDFLALYTCMCTTQACREVYRRSDGTCATASQIAWGRRAADLQSTRYVIVVRAVKADGSLLSRYQQAISSSCPLSSWGPEAPFMFTGHEVALMYAPGRDYYEQVWGFFPPTPSPFETMGQPYPISHGDSDSSEKKWLLPVLVGAGGVLIVGLVAVIAVVCIRYRRSQGSAAPNFRGRSASNGSEVVVGKIAEVVEGRVVVPLELELQQKKPLPGLDSDVPPTGA